MSEILESVQRLTRDLRNAAVTLSDAEARFLVDAYYQMQKDRIRAEHQDRTLVEVGQPHDVVKWLHGQRSTLEGQIARALDTYSDAKLVGRWARSIVGIGPIISAGLLAHIDIEKAPTVGHIWRFAGLDPTVGWERSEKRPWNAELKRLCWIIGQSFIKVHNHERDVYGKVYATRKAQEVQRNEQRLFAEQAAEALRRKNYRKDTKAKKHYEAGQLPPARIELRAARYATKLFLAHYHHVLHEVTYNRPPPKPYVLEHLGHVHYIAPPNWPME